MKKLFLILASFSTLVSCQKEEIKPNIQLNRIEAGIKFVETYVDDFYLSGVDSLEIHVQGQKVSKFKTYLDDCKSITYIYTMESENNQEEVFYTIKADGQQIESGTLLFKAPYDLLIKD